MDFRRGIASVRFNLNGLGPGEYGVVHRGWPYVPQATQVVQRAVALETGLLGEGMIGVTFGYGIYVCEGHVDNRLISHECRHVYQYESAGSIESFLPVYLHQIATIGYNNAPLEVDARAHELDVA